MSPTDDNAAQPPPHHPPKRGSQDQPALSAPAFTGLLAAGFAAITACALIGGWWGLGGIVVIATALSTYMIHRH